MKIFVVLWAMVATIAALDPADPSCVVCLRGTCLASAAFYGNTKSLDTYRAMMYHNGNIMYYKDSWKLFAINLDYNTITQIPKLTYEAYGNVGLDVVTGDVYYYDYSSGNGLNSVYKYEPKSNESKIIVLFDQEEVKRPYESWAFNGTLYFTTRDKKLNLETGLNFFTGLKIERVPALENVIVYDIFFNPIGTMYIQSRSKVYILKAVEDGTLKLTEVDAEESSYRISVDKNGDPYLFNYLKRIIYQFDPITGQQNKIGAYGEPRYLERVMFDKNNNLIFIDDSSETIKYYKRTSDSCVFDDQVTPVKITKLSNTTKN